MSEEPQHVVILGAGFGGLRAARALARAPLRVTLIDRQNYHLFQPLLYQVATSMLSSESIAYPIRTILRRQPNVEFRLAEVEAVDLEARRVRTSTGAVDYDALIVAVGSETSFFGLDSVRRNGFGLKHLHDAVGVRNQILRSFELAAQESDPERRRAHLTFAVVGGGPTGVESSGALSELIRLVLARDFRGLEIKDVRVILLEATHQLLTGMPEKLREATAEQLWRKHVEVRFGARVTEFDGERLALAGGEILPCRTVIWAAGVRAAGLAGELGVEPGAQGRIPVRPTLQLPVRDEVFVIGDAALVEAEGGPLPMLAPIAIRQGEHAARNAVALLGGAPLEDFAYRGSVTMAVIGRGFAVASFGRLRTAGFLAWLLWIVAHIAFLIGFRNRLVVLINWAWEYFRYERAVRVIDAATVEARRERGEPGELRAATSRRT